MTGQELNLNVVIKEIIIMKSRRIINLVLDLILIQALLLSFQNSSFKYVCFLCLKKKIAGIKLWTQVTHKTPQISGIWVTGMLYHSFSRGYDKYMTKQEHSQIMLSVVK